ncbi:MAG: GNAT family N-acetyltransferase [Bacteroidota bacterium]
MIVLETERLILRHATVGDAPFMFKLLNDPSWIEFIGDRGIKTVEDAQNYILDRIIKSYEENGFGLFLTVLKKDKTPIGLCGLVNRPQIEDVDIGFAFMPGFKGKGYGYESASAVIKYGREKFGLQKIAAITVKENVRSIALIKKLGLRYEKTFAFDGSSDMAELYVSD